MEQRTLGRTDQDVSVVGLGTWQLGADWGDVSEDDALAVLEASVDAGVTFFDTADVYGDGRSEQVIGTFLKDPRRHHGRHQDGPPDGPGARELLARQLPRLDRPVPAQPRRRHPRPGAAALPAERDASTRTRRTTPWTRWSTRARSRRTALSVETCDQALSAIARPHVASIQIILNAFRLKPLDAVLPAAQEAGVGIIARVPLASGLLSGKYDEQHDLRRRRPPHLQPRRQRLRRGGDVRRAWTSRPGCGRPGSSRR